MNPLHFAGWEKYSGIFLICPPHISKMLICCLLNTSDAADDTPCVDLGGRRIIERIRIFFIDYLLYF